MFLAEQLVFFFQPLDLDSHILMPPGQKVGLANLPLSLIKRRLANFKIIGKLLNRKPARLQKVNGVMPELIAEPWTAFLAHKWSP